MKKNMISKPVRIVVFAFFALYAISLLLPMFFGLLNSFKTMADYRTFDIFPKEWKFDNYAKAFMLLQAGKGLGFLVMFFNSLWYAGGGTVLAVIVSAMVAYAVAKYKFPGNKFIYSLALVTMTLPIVGAMPSQFRVYHALGVLNNPLMLLTVAGGFGFNFVVLYSFFKSIPWSFAEAAFIDGASHLKTFLRVMLPQAISVMAAVSIVAFIGMWNDYMGPILFLESYPTISSGLYKYQVINERKIDYPVLFAGIFISMIPVLVLFIAFQNTILEMTFTGGLKG